MSRNMDETGTVFGQDMTARYHATDTWMRRNGQWQIVAGPGAALLRRPSASGRSMTLNSVGMLAPTSLLPETG